MAKQLCAVCKLQKAFIKRPKTSEPICQECFFECFENEVHETIINNGLFKPGDKIAIGASGGKDSTVVVHVLNKLNKKHKYGVELYMLAVDEGIKGYRDFSLDSVTKSQQAESLPLLVVSYQKLYGWTMDSIVR
jgi:cytoplasmic tRNA 2-thiolation protein 1